jgi:hypothetical protein
MKYVSYPLLTHVQYVLSDIAQRTERGKVTDEPESMWSSLEEDELRKLKTQLRRLHAKGVIKTFRISTCDDFGVLEPEEMEYCLDEVKLNWTAYSFQ